MKVGAGFSGLVVHNQKLVLFHRQSDSEVIEAFTAADGKRLWHFDYPTAYRDDFGFDEGPRATPTLTDTRVYTFGAEGALYCLDLETGTVLWHVATREQFHAPKGFFGMACSPLVLDGKVLVNIGGTDSAGIVAFDERTGKPLWQATGDEASYASPVSAAWDGQIHALFFARSGLVSLDPRSGAVQFQFPWRSRSHASVNAATPVVQGDLVFLSASYGTGAILLQIKDNHPRKVWSSDEALSNHYATSVLSDGFLYGFHGRQEYGQSFRSVELRTGKVRWSRESFGAGSVLLAGNTLVVMKEDGQLLLLAASPAAYKELARAQVLPGTVRAFPAVADGFFYARSKDQLACLDLREKP